MPRARYFLKSFRPKLYRVGTMEVYTCEAQGLYIYQLLHIKNPCSLCRHCCVLRIVLKIHSHYFNIQRHLLVFSMDSVV
jgi:hypothetical protein